MTKQNRSSAVMQQRVEADDSLDDFPTPPWATRALMEHVLKRLIFHSEQLSRPTMALEPCCNRGHMALPLAEYFDRVWTSDVQSYGWDKQDQVADFLFPGFNPTPGLEHDPDERMIAWTIGNPPFRLAVEFIQKAREISRFGAAMLVRTSFLEGGDRYRDLFSKTPPTVVAQFAERVIMHKGILRDPSKTYWNPLGKNKQTGKKTGAWQKPSTATSYCWMVWMRDAPPQPFAWIPPCRRQLERPGDYPVTTDSDAPPR